MSSIVYQTDRRSGSTYAYRSEPVRDPVTGRPSQRRTYLGRVETGEIVPKAAKGKRNRSRVGEAPQEPLTVAESSSLRDESERLRAEVSRLQARVDELEGLVSRIAAQCGEVLKAGEYQQRGAAYRRHSSAQFSNYSLFDIMNTNAVQNHKKWERGLRWDSTI